MHFALAVLAMVLFAGGSAFAGCGMDPDGCRGAAVRSASSDQGMGTDPDGRTRTARVAGVASSDQGGGIDPDGKPSR